MFNPRMARETCWAIFERQYPDYLNEDERYLEKIRDLLPNGALLLDAGGGWELPFAHALADACSITVGVDLGLDRQSARGNVLSVEANLEDLPFPRSSFDVVITRSVLEHLVEPKRVFREMARVLKPGGHLVFLTPNLWDYVSLVSRLIPNRLHGAIVKTIQGRDERDTFPTYYRANTVGRLERLCSTAGLELLETELLSQYPAYLMFSPRLFRVGIWYDKFLRRHEALAWLRCWILGVAKLR